MRWTELLITAVVATLAAVCAHGAEGAPDAAAVLEEANTSPTRVVYEEDVEGPKPPGLKLGYSRPPLGGVEFLGVTEEEARSGKRSYKMQVSVPGGKGQSVYFYLPFVIPAWSDLEATFYVKPKVDGDIRVYYTHGFIGANATTGDGGMTVKGAKIGEENGWEKWRTTISRSNDVGKYVEGLAIRFDQKGQSDNVMTLYLDDVTVEGKLPSNYAGKWQSVYRYLTVDRGRYLRKTGIRRLAAMKAFRDELRAVVKKVKLPPDVGDLVREQYDACRTRVEADLGQVAPMCDAIEKAIKSKNARFNADLNAPERVLNDSGLYADILQAYPAYAKQYGDQDYVTFTLDPTRSYRILPGGPAGHRDEISYYAPYGGGLENPQILPDAKPVPAIPSRVMRGFGCRGTTVPLSFAILTGKALRNLTFETSDLESGDHTIPADRIDLRVVAPWWRPMDGKGARLMNEMLLHDPSFVVPRTDKPGNVYKDPKFGNDAETLLPVTIEAGTTRQFYVTVKIPDDAAAGLYQGAITARAEDGASIPLRIELEVLPFDLEPTPYAYGFFYTSYLEDEAAAKRRGIHSWFKTPAQMEAEFANMAEHGCNTLNLYEGKPRRTDDGWDLSVVNQCLEMALRAGLTRSPFVWLGRPLPISPYPDQPEPYPYRTVEQVVEAWRQTVPRINAFCDERGYPRPAYFGADEASGERLIQLRDVYAAIHDAGGLVAAACYPDYFDEIGDALSLPIVMGGAQTAKGQEAIRASQEFGYECWIYNCPTTNHPASPSVYRRRYGLAMWRNGEQGAMPWEYQGMPFEKNKSAYSDDFEMSIFAMTYPTWNGGPIDTIHYEAFREGVYDTRYMATLQKRLDEAKASGAAPELVKDIEKWLADFSVNDDLEKVRRRMADFIIQLNDTLH